MTTPPIFITGAAASIGKATALRFLAGGWRVGAYDISAQGLESLAQAADSMGCGHLLVAGQLDVSNNDQWQVALAPLAATPVEPMARPLTYVKGQAL
jgi:NAD(P)-dependent dehydrogenase (short-subunit alcohol dehydrogenase family)